MSPTSITLLTISTIVATFVSCSSPAARASASAAPTEVAADARAEPPPSSSIEFVPGHSPTIEVTRAPTGHLLVQPKIHGTDAGYWIFDTGAGICCIDPTAVQPLGLRATGSIEAVGIGGASTQQTYLADQLELGPLRLRNHPLMATDLAFLEKPLGRKIHGIIGYGVLSQCVVEFDFVLPRLQLHDPAHYELTGANWAELNLDGRTPAVRARFEGHEGLFQIDTGQNTAVVCQHAAVQRWQLEQRPGLRDAKVRGVGGDITAKAGTLDWLEFGGVRQERVEALFLLEAKGSRSASARDGAIGAALLNPFVMITDYSHHRIAFRRNR